MNQQIQALALKCGAWHQVYGNRTFMIDEHFDIEKFSQLIVKECLFQVDKIRDGLEADGEDQQALGADWAGLAVARHFGVEE